MSELFKKAQNFPNKPGIYIFRGRSSRPIYIGKAKALKKRILSYFKASQESKANAIVRNAVNLECIITSTEIEALLLENTLIKKHKPYYNVLLRDDKQYPYIKVTVNEEWPRVTISRRIDNDGASYFGPYRGKTANNILKTFKRLFQLRWCKKFRIRKEPCFYYHLDKCLAPCIQNISKHDYMIMVNEAIDYLNGNLDSVVERLKQEMRKASDNQKYEKAANMRNRILSFQRILEGQEVCSARNEDKDIVCLNMAGTKALFLVLQLRKGKLIGKQSYFINDTKSESETDLIYSATVQYYTSASNIPNEVIISPSIKDRVGFKKTISYIKNGKVNVALPKSGNNLRLYEMASENANFLMAQNLKIFSGEIEVLNELKNVLKLRNMPRRIEAFDISTIMGKETVGSMVVFEDGKPMKSHYRKFKVNEANKPNDVFAMNQVVSRRYSGKLSKELPLPDLILVDGGKPQISAAQRAIKGTVAEAIPMIGLAKRFEQIYLPNRLNPLNLSKRSEALKLLQRIRDEAHRFAITFHKLRRKKAMLK